MSSISFPKLKSHLWLLRLGFCWLCLCPLHHSTVSLGLGKQIFWNISHISITCRGAAVWHHPNWHIHSHSCWEYWLFLRQLLTSNDCSFLEHKGLVPLLQFRATQGPSQSWDHSLCCNSTSTSVQSYFLTPSYRCCSCKPAPGDTFLFLTSLGVYFQEIWPTTAWFQVPEIIAVGFYGGFSTQVWLVKSLVVDG